MPRWNGRIWSPAASRYCRDYLLGQRLCRDLTRRATAATADVAALVTPTLPILPPRIGQRIWTYDHGATESVEEALIRFTAPFNITGWPAIAQPCATVAAGLSVSVQLAGRAGDEAGLLRIAAALEQALDGGPQVLRQDRLPKRTMPFE